MTRIETEAFNKTAARPWWTPKQIAENLQVTLRTVQRWIGSGALPVHRFGRSVRVSNADYRRFIARGREAGGRACDPDDDIK